MWEQLITCYSLLGKKPLAQELINKRLQVSGRAMPVCAGVRVHMVLRRWGQCRACAVNCGSRCLSMQACHPCCPLILCSRHPRHDL